MILDLSAWDGDPSSIEDREDTLLEMDRRSAYDGYITDLGNVSLSRDAQE